MTHWTPRDEIASILHSLNKTLLAGITIKISPPSMCNTNLCFNTSLFEKKRKKERFWENLLNIILRWHMVKNSKSAPLTGGNWQKWKRVFLTCPCHEIYRDEAVVLKSCKYTWKITIFVKMWNLGQYRENLIFCE